MAANSNSKDRLLSLYRNMLLIRRCEEQLAKSHQRGLVHGACHTYVGQEAIAVGVCAHLSSADAVFSTHRGHGHAHDGCECEDRHAQKFSGGDDEAAAS